MVSDFGFPVVLTSLIFFDSKAYVHALRAYGVVIATVFAAGAAGLLYANFAINENSLPEWFRFREVIGTNIETGEFGGIRGKVDRVAFARAGTIHNSSHLGGWAGIVIALLYLRVKRSRLNGQ